MAGPQRKVSFFLTGSVDEQQTAEFKGPIVQQGGTPNLDDSRNTRLSLERGTCVRAPDVTPLGVDLPDGHPAFAIVGNNRKRNHVLYTTPDQQNRIFGEDAYEARATGNLVGPGGSAPQSYYVPLQMSGAGQIPGVSSGTGIDQANTDGIASCYNDVRDELWYAWTEYQDVLQSQRFLFVCAFDREGTMLVTPTIVVREGVENEMMWPVGLSAHGASGVRLWYAARGADSPSSPAGRYRSLSIAAGRPVLGALVPIPMKLLGYRNVFSVSAQDATYAYVAGWDSGVDGCVLKVNINTGATQKLVFAGAWSGYAAYASVYCRLIAGAYRIAVIFSSQVNANVNAVLNDTLGYVLPQQTGGAVGKANAAGPVSAKFLLCPVSGVSAAVFAFSYVDGGANDPHYTIINLRNLDGSISPNSETLYWQRQYNQGAEWDVSATEAYPIFFMSRFYNRVYGIDFQGAELLDPSIVGYIVGPGGWSTPIARFGCVRGAMAPAAVKSPMYLPPTTSVPRIGNDLVVSYRKDDLYGTARYVKLQVAPEQPQVANDRDGVAIVAAALVVQWDGAETVEWGGPLHAPQMVIDNGTDDDYLTTPAAGVYSFAAVYEWVDNAGLSHRSMPCPTQTHTFDGTQHLRVRVTSPDTMRRSDATSGNEIAAALYMTSGTSGTDYERYAIDYTSQVGYYDDWTVISGSRPIIYSRGLLGEELTPQPPPPLRDVTIVGSRCWGIDAEIPTRIVYSKLRVAGIGFEFFPAGEVIVPSTAGDVIALREQSGSLIVFTERAIYQVSDGGPNNMGSGSFGSPYKISDLGTRNRRAVVSTAQGIMFLDNAGCFSMLRGSAVVQLPGAAVRQNVIGAFVLEDAEEVVFPVGTEAKVYNYALSRWTNWDLPETPLLVAQSAITRNAGLMYGQGTGRTYTVLSTVLSRTALMSWETDWILFGGDVMDYTVLYDVIFSAYNLSDHGIRIELCTEYDGVTATTSRQWTAAELLALTGPTGRYTVRIEPVRQDTRGAKIKISELVNAGDHRGMRPLALTIVHSIDGMTYEESNIPGSHK